MINCNLKFLVTIFTTSISIFPTPGITQTYPTCFMITSSGQVVNLNKLCQTHTQSQVVQITCQEPLNSNGVPIAYVNELERLKKVIASTENDNDYGSSFLKVQLAAIALLERIPLSQNSQELLQQQKLLINQLQVLTNPEETEELYIKIMGNFEYVTKEFEKNPCYKTIIESLNKNLK